eukprot:366578-Chlamydomonas_euryale.AAC.15
MGLPVSGGSHVACAQEELGYRRPSSHWSEFLDPGSLHSVGTAACPPAFSIPEDCFLRHVSTCWTIFLHAHSHEARYHFLHLVFRAPKSALALSENPGPSKLCTQRKLALPSPRLLTKHTPYVLAGWAGMAWGSTGSIRLASDS